MGTNADIKTTDPTRSADFAVRGESRYVIGTAEAKALAALRSKAISEELRRVSRKSRRPQVKTNVGGGFRARRRDRMFRNFIIGLAVLFVALPSLGSAVYLVFLSADQFVTEAKLSIRSGDAASISMPLGLSGLLDTNQSRDVQIVAEYVRSPALVDALLKTTDLRTMFSRAPQDFVATLPADNSAEKLASYWRKQISIDVDSSVGLIDLKVRAFTPADSLAITEAVIQQSEKMVNELTRRKELEEFRRSDEEFNLARQRLQTAVAALSDMRNSVGLLDVGVTERSYGDILTALRMDLSDVQLMIDSYKRQNLTASPEMAPLKARESALKDQISIYEARIAGGGTATTIGTGTSPTLVASSAGLAEKETDLSIARTEYMQAASSYEQARLTLESKRTYLLLYVKPRLAETSLYPPRFLIWIGVTVIGFLVFALIWGLSVLVRDNMA